MCIVYTVARIRMFTYGTLKILLVRWITEIRKDPAYTCRTVLEVALFLRMLKPSEFPSRA